MTDTGSTLADARVGVSVVLGRPGGAPERARRLAEMGLRAGAHVRVLQRTAGGGRVVAVDDARVALDCATLRLLPVVHVASPHAGAEGEG